MTSAARDRPSRDQSGSANVPLSFVSRRAGPPETGAVQRPGPPAWETNASVFPSGEKATFPSRMGEPSSDAVIRTAGAPGRAPCTRMRDARGVFSFRTGSTRATCEPSGEIATPRISRALVRRA